MSEASIRHTGLTNILYFRLHFISVLCIRLNAILSDLFCQLLAVQKFDFELLQTESTKRKYKKVTDTDIGAHIFHRTYSFLPKTYHGDKGQYTRCHGQRYSRQKSTVSSISSNAPLCNHTSPTICSVVKLRKDFGCKKKSAQNPLKKKFLSLNIPYSRVAVRLLLYRTCAHVPSFIRVVQDLVLLVSLRASTH